MFKVYKKEIEVAGKKISLETGKVARQADGAIIATSGETVILATVVGAKKVNPDMDYFPLSVNYQEKYYAGGKIPGGYFKREARPTESETLISRLIDRPIRPLFPDEFKNEVQLLPTVISYDKDNQPDILAITASSALTMIPELAILMLACARIGAVHSIIFGGFSADSISGRVNDCESEYIITADEGVRGGKTIPLKATTDEALRKCPDVKKCIVVKRTGNPIDWDDDRDVWYHDLIKDVSNNCEPEEMNAEDPLFILYTSGSTGKPKGVLHTTGGYMVYASMTHQYIFNYKQKDIYWCTADIGWVTGHSYIIYGPLANGATTLMFEGIPNYPDTSRWWQIIDKFKVNIFYTAPTAIRALMR